MIIKNTFCKYIIIVLLFGTISGYAAPEFSKYFDSDRNSIVEIDPAIASISDSDVLTQSSNIGAIVPLLLSNDVDLSPCSSKPVQCKNHTYYGANATNHNPVAIGILVTANGVGVTGLTASNFAFYNGIVPAGAYSAVVCTQAICGNYSIGSGYMGQYLIFVHPGVKGANWKAGHYFAALAVKTAKYGTVTSLVSWQIPQN